ncbi:rod shape-determining protein [Streptomyces sp. A1-5]|uniref:rod shape-determining protein n=1 Tax=Streptomyces sp. A1-5 TaxID=2738410 RepID=UPI001F4023EF|nr:rod shape-determining protein [Streptomyces sp. A1-5]UJB41914.1 rod shape-determining protein [Streptomyces sp. A1-5]
MFIGKEADKRRRDRSVPETVNIVTVELVDDLVVRVNQRQVFDGPPVVSDGPNGEVLAGSSAQEPVRRALTAGIITNSRALEQLLRHIAKPFLDELDARPTPEGGREATVVLVVLTEEVYRIDRSMVKELVKKVWGADVRVVTEPECKLVAMGLGEPIWGPTGCLVSVLNTTYASSAVISSGEVIVQGSAPLTGPATGSSEPLPPTSEDKLRVLTSTLERVVADAGPGFAQTITDNGVVVAVNDKELAIPDRLASDGSGSPIRARVGMYSTKQALIRGILAYETRKEDLFVKGYIRSSK